MVKKALFGSGTKNLFKFLRFCVYPLAIWGMGKTIFLIKIYKLYIHKDVLEETIVIYWIADEDAQVCSCT